MDLREARKQWGKLHDQWAEAHVEAQAARSLCTSKFQAGAGPTEEELENALALEAREYELRGKMDEFASNFLGE